MFVVVTFFWQRVHECQVQHTGPQFNNCRVYYLWAKVTYTEVLTILSSMMTLCTALAIALATSLLATLPSSEVTVTSLWLMSSLAGTVSWLVLVLVARDESGSGN